MIQPKIIIKNLDRMKDFGNDRRAFVRLDKNERTTSFPVEVFQGMMNEISSELLPMYPDQMPLYKKLAGFYEIPESNILLSPGSDAAIKNIFEVYLDLGEEVIFLNPTYAMIDVYASMYGAKKIKIGYDANLELDFNKLIDSITLNTRIVFIANPNQPTGTVLSEIQIQQLLRKTRETNTLIVFDEAYQPFSNQPSILKFINDYSNLIVIQTFSKAFGLASARLGIIFSDSENINYLYKVKTLADINLFAIKLGEYLIDNYNIVADYIKSVNESKKLIEVELEKYGIIIIRSYSNFIHMKLPEKYDLKYISVRMKEKGYLIRISGMGLPAVLEGCIRITVGPLDQMKMFLEVFEQLLESI